MTHGSEQGRIVFQVGEIGAMAFDRNIQTTIARTDNRDDRHGLRSPAHGRQPELNPMAAMLVRKSVDSLTHQRDHCSSCRRVPLAGELLHELESHRVVCQLCLARLPESKRDTVSTQRVHVGDRPLSVVPRAA